MSLLIALLCILFFGAALLLVILNHSTADVNLLFKSYEQVPIAVVMVVSLLVGILFTSFISIIDGIKIRLRNRQLRKMVVRLENEMDELRHPSDGLAEQHEEYSTPPKDYTAR